MDIHEEIAMLLSKIYKETGVRVDRITAGYSDLSGIGDYKTNCTYVELDTAKVINANRL